MNPFIHVELNSPEPDKAKAFYGKLFQWQLEGMSNAPVSDDPYTVINVGEGAGGGIMKQGSKRFCQLDSLRTGG